MPNSTKQKINSKNEIITKAKLEPFFNNIKELIISTAKGTETVLKNEIQRVENRLEKKIEITQHAVLEHTKEIKSLKSNMQQTEKRLDEKIDVTRAELKSNMQQMEKRLDEKIDVTRAELKETKKYLSDKIDNIGERLDDHETRITTLETVRV